MKSLTQFIQEACKGNNCKNKKNLQDILNNKKRLKEINDILGESLEEINELINMNPNSKTKIININEMINKINNIKEMKNKNLTTIFKEFISEYIY